TRDVAGFGADAVTTGPGNDIILGGAGTDNINAADGNNVVAGDFAQIDNAGTLLSIESTDFASGAADIIQLTAGTNAVIGGAGADQITAGSGSNTILGDDGQAFFFANGDLRLIESINLGNGDDDIITLQDGSNSVIAGAGNDTISVGAGSNFVFGDEGKREVLTDGGGNPTGTTEVTSLNGSVGGQDGITVGSGYNVAVGGADVDTITVNGTTPAARGIVLGDNGKLVLDNAGTLLSIESTDFASGAADIIQLTAGTNAIVGGRGADQITAGTGNNTILGDDGQATFFGNGDLEEIQSTNPGSGGDDQISLQAGTNVVIGGAGNDSVSAASGTNTILGDEGRATLFTDGTLKLILSTNLGVGGHDQITLVDGINSVIAGFDNDIISVGSGTNFVFGDEGRREVLTDGAGIPTGITEVTSLNGSVGGQDNITVGSGYNVVAGGANSDTIAVNGTTASARGIVLGDNGLMRLSNAGTLLSIHSTEFAGGNDDDITLTAGSNAVIGGQGDDNITAGSGINTILGDDGIATFFVNGDLQDIRSLNSGNGGHDDIQLTSGTNSVIAGSGNDAVNVGSGNNLIVGDEGEAILNADGTVDQLRTLNSGIGGTDTVTLGSGTNVVIAGAASDSVSLGEGIATVLGDEGQRVVSRNPSGTITGTVIETINDAVGADDTIVANGASSLVMGGAGSDTITGNAATGGGTDPSFIIAGDAARAEFDGVDQLRLFLTKSPTTGSADTITLVSANDIVFGGTGDDIIHAGDGNNIIAGDHARAVFDANGTLLTLQTTDTGFAGHDIITTGFGNGIVIGGSGMDSITIAGGINKVLGDNGLATFDATGQLLELVSENLSDGSDDTIRTGGGNDIVIAGTGSDDVATTGGHNRILGDSGRLIFDASGILRSMTSIDDASGASDTINSATGDDLIIGGEGSDVVAATGGHNIIVGDFGNIIFDVLGILTQVFTRDVAGFGADAVTTGPGNDIILGGAGTDNINAADGNNVVAGDFAQI
ncbi:MAG: calcium-binding protein, partial [Fuerstiella sp.]|nr:calcium-binding protein [Fuerstiella sp.]